MEYLRGVTDDAAKADVVQRIGDLAERYAPDTQWFIDTMTQARGITCFFGVLRAGAGRQHPCCCVLRLPMLSELLTEASMRLTPNTQGGEQAPVERGLQEAFAGCAVRAHNPCQLCPPTQFGPGHVFHTVRRCAL